MAIIELDVLNISLLSADNRHKRLVWWWKIYVLGIWSIELTFAESTWNAVPNFGLTFVWPIENLVFGRKNRLIGRRRINFGRRRRNYIALRPRGLRLGLRYDRPPGSRVLAYDAPQPFWGGRIAKLSFLRRWSQEIIGDYPRGPWAGLCVHKAPKGPRRAGKSRFGWPKGWFECDSPMSDLFWALHSR